MGSLYWQLNDCWPVASWSSIDSFGRWKALQYYARRFYSPLLISPVVEDGSINVYAVSDKTTPTDAEVRLRLMSMDGRVLDEEHHKVTLPALSSASYLSLPLEGMMSKDQTGDNVFVTTNLVVAGQAVSFNIVYLVSTKQVHLPPAKIQSELSGSGGKYTLKLTTDLLARDVYVTFGDQDVRLSDNYLDLLPGQYINLSLTSAATLNQLKSAMKVISLVDAFNR
jgi:beta-mannosidase